MHCVKPFDRSLLDSAIVLAESFLSQEEDYLPFYWNFFIEQYNTALLVDSSTHLNDVEKAYKRLMFSLDVLKETSCRQLLTYLIDELDHVNFLTFTKERWLSLIDAYVLSKTYLDSPNMGLPTYDLLLCDSETVLERLKRLYRKEYTYRGIPWDNDVLFENGYGWNDGDGTEFKFFNAYYTSPTEAQLHWLFEEPHLDPFHVYISQSPIRIDSLPPPIATVEPVNSIKGYTATGLSEDTTYYFAIGTMGSDGYVLTNVIIKNDKEVISHYPLLSDLSNTLGGSPAIFVRASKKYVLENAEQKIIGGTNQAPDSIMIDYDLDEPAHVSNYLGLGCTGLLLEPFDTNLLRQNTNLMDFSVWGNAHSTSYWGAENPSASDIASPLASIDNFRVPGANNTRFQVTPSVGDYAVTKVMAKRTVESDGSIHFVGIGGTTGSTYRRTISHMSSVFNPHTEAWAEWSNVWGTIPMRYIDAISNGWQLTELLVEYTSGTRGGGFSIKPGGGYLFLPCLQNYLFTTLIPTGTSTATHAPDVLTIDSPANPGKVLEFQCDFSVFPQDSSSGKITDDILIVQGINPDKSNADALTLTLKRMYIRYQVVSKSSNEGAKTYHQRDSSYDCYFTVTVAGIVVDLPVIPLVTPEGATLTLAVDMSNNEIKVSLTAHEDFTRYEKTEHHTTNEIPYFGEKCELSGLGVISNVKWLTK